MGLYIFWPDEEELYSEGVVTVDLVQAMPEVTYESTVKTGVASHTDLSKNIELSSREIDKIESRPAQKLVAAASVSHEESDKQMNDKPEERAVLPPHVLSQDEIKAEQAQFQRNQQRIRAQLEKNKWYPASARRRGIEGDVELGFSLNNRGYARHAVILTRSGYAMLDQAALETIRRAEPFPANGGEYRFRLRFRRL